MKNSKIHLSWCLFLALVCSISTQGCAKLFVKPKPAKPVSRAEFNTVVSEATKTRNRCESYDDACVKVSYEKELSQLDSLFDRANKNRSIQVAITQRVHQMALESDALGISLSSLHSKANSFSRSILGQYPNEPQAIATRAIVLASRGGNEKEVGKLVAKCLKLDPGNSYCRKLQ